MRALAMGLLLVLYACAPAGDGADAADIVLMGSPEGLPANAPSRFSFGSDAPARKTIGNYWQHSTTLFDYIRRAMPQMTPGLLNSDQTYAVIAYLLYLNEIVPDDAVMNAQTLPAVAMPARDRFVIDDRAGGIGPVR